MASRRQCRILAFQALYSREVGKDDLSSILDFSWLEDDQKAKLDDADCIFTKMLVSGTIENLEVIDKKIQEHLTRWDLNRISKVDLSLLRISVYPLLFQSDIPSSVVIDEAISISKEFGSDDSYKFINAILDNIRKSVIAEK